MWNSIQVGFTEHLRNVYKSVKMKWTPVLASRNCPVWRISIFQNEKAWALSLAIGRWWLHSKVNVLKAANCTLWNGFGCVCVFYFNIEKKCAKTNRRKKGPCLLGVFACLREDAGRDGLLGTEVLTNLSSFCLVDICHSEVCATVWVRTRGLWKLGMVASVHNPGTWAKTRGCWD